MNNAEKAAVAQFMGQMYGEAKKIDNNVVYNSKNLRSASQEFERALRDHLQSQGAPNIPPNPQELAAAHAADNRQHVDQSTAIHPSYNQPATQEVLITPDSSSAIPRVPVVPVHTDKTDISVKLDTIIKQLETITQALLSYLNVDKHEYSNTSDKPRGVSTISRSNSEG